MSNRNSFVARRNTAADHTRSNRKEDTGRNGFENAGGPTGHRGGRLRAVLQVLTLCAATAAAARAADVKGPVSVPVGPLVPGVEFTGTNRTGRDICDFTFALGEGCGREIRSVTVTSAQAGGAGDWDVDDNKSGESQQTNENDDTDGTEERITRVDSKGTGNEPAPQNAGGICIRDGENFTISIAFDGNTNNACTLMITPTDFKDFELASLDAGLREGDNALAVDNGTALFPGVGTGMVNMTGQLVLGLVFRTTGDYNMLMGFEVDPYTNEEINAVQCDSLGRNDCTLMLARPVPPGGIVAVDAAFDQLAPGDYTFLYIQPILGGPVPVDLRSWGRIKNLYR